jgi:hypothetical protein
MVIEGRTAKLKEISVVPLSSIASHKKGRRIVARRPNCIFLRIIPGHDDQDSS